jgi:hypothetical protein
MPSWGHRCNESGAVPEFHVIDISLDGSRAALQDRSGSLHVVRAEAGALHVHDRLHGGRARPGRQWLLLRDASRGLAVNFEHVDCDQFLALERVHDEAVGTLSA